MVCPFTHVGLRRFVQHRTEAAARRRPSLGAGLAPRDRQRRAARAGRRGRGGRRSPPRRRARAFAGVPGGPLPGHVASGAGAGRGRLWGQPRGRRAGQPRAARRCCSSGASTSPRPTCWPSWPTESGVAFDPRRPIRGADGPRSTECGAASIGSPHFFTPAGGFFCPSLDVSRDATGRLRVAADPDRFDRFVESCFA